MILGDGRGDAAGQRPGRHRLRVERRDRADPAQRRGGQAPRLGGAAAAAAGLPRRRLVAHRPAGRPGRRPAREAGAAPDHRLAPTSAAARPRRCAPVHGLHAGQHRPGLDPAHALAGAAGRRARPAPPQGHRGLGHRRAGQPERRPARRVARATGSRSRSTARTRRGPGITEVDARHRRGPDPDLPPRRPAGDVLLARPPRPADRPPAPRRCPSCSPRSCAGSTRTTCTPPPRSR